MDLSILYIYAYFPKIILYRNTLAKDVCEKIYKKNMLVYLLQIFTNCNWGQESPNTNNAKVFSC